MSPDTAKGSPGTSCQRLSVCLLQNTPLGWGAPEAILPVPSCQPLPPCQPPPPWQLQSVSLGCGKRVNCRTRPGLSLAHLVACVLWDPWLLGPAYTYTQGPGLPHLCPLALWATGVGMGAASSS